MEAHDIKLEIDVQAQKLLELLLKNFQSTRFTAKNRRRSIMRHQWVVDPLDGTVSISMAFRIFASRSLCASGAEIIVGVVYDPIREEMWTGQRAAEIKWHHSRDDRADLADAIISVSFKPA